MIIYKIAVNIEKNFMFELFFEVRKINVALKIVVEFNTRLNYIIIKPSRRVNTVNIKCVYLKKVI